MTLSPRMNRLVFATHVTTSLAWLGAVMCFLVLAVFGYSSSQPQVAQAAYLAMNLICWFVILPLSLASPASGIVQALGTAWGLMRHYWVAVKLFVTVPSCIILLLHMVPTSRLATAAANGTLDDPAVTGLRLQLIGDAAAAVFVLLVVTALSIYKPKGRTASGSLAKARARFTPRWIVVLRWSVVVLALVFLASHLTGNGLHRHG